MFINNGTAVASESPVEDNPLSSAKSEIAHEILSYLSEHPDAQDTVEGIAEWWLLECKIRYQTELVKETLSELVKKGYLIENRQQESHICYRLNKTREQ